MKDIKALIVEDELLIAETIKLFLTERGHTVVGIAISYEEAIQLIDECNPEVILLDVRLYGNKSGIDVAKYMLETKKRIPYIMVSSQYDAKIIEDSMFAGASGYVTKPISKETLWATVELAVMKQNSTEVDHQLNDILNKERITSSTKNNKKHSFSKEEINWLKQVEHFVLESLNGDFLSVSWLATEFAMSESTLKRKLKKLTGLNPAKYIAEHRLVKAKQLIESNEYSTISQVARRVGFSNLSSFTRSFKQRFGVVPTEVL